MTWIIVHTIIGAGAIKGTIVLRPQLCSEVDEQTGARTRLTFNLLPLSDEDCRGPGRTC